jgi:hypothetical protein
VRAGGHGRGGLDLQQGEVPDGVQEVRGPVGVEELGADRDPSCLLGGEVVHGPTINGWQDEGRPDSVRHIMWIPA